MSSMSSYSIGVSGLRNAQSGLSTTGHNMANSGVDGYTRQGNIQQSFLYKTYGENKNGLLQMGLGTDLSEIRQIRNKFFDAEYRTEAGTANFYAAKYVTGQEIENVIGELESAYAAQDVITDVWEALNELTIYPDGIETRETFIATCCTFMNKMNVIQDGLFNYQLNLNGQIKTTVNKINDLVKKIDDLNDKVMYYEANGDHANDYRDSRNNLIDELSTYLDITVKESANGRVDILAEGKEIIVNGAINTIGLKYSREGYPFVEPVFTKSTEILPADPEDDPDNPDVPTEPGTNSNRVVRPLFDNLNEQNFSAGSSNCSGLLKGLLIARGDIVGEYNTPNEQINNFMIPTIQKKFDNLVNKIAALLNDTFHSGNTVDLKGGKGVDIFSKINTDKGLTTKNIQVNPKLLESDGYNYLALSPSGDVADTTAILDVMEKWENGLDGLADDLGVSYSVNNYYRSIIDGLSVEVEESGSYYDEHTALLTAVDNKRQTLSGVSLDEELSYMLKYQYAYQASSKFINIIDSMVDKVVNSMGVVGR